MVANPHLHDRWNRIFSKSRPHTGPGFHLSQQCRVNLCRRAICLQTKSRSLPRLHQGPGLRRWPERSDRSWHRIALDAISVRADIPGNVRIAAGKIVGENQRQAALERGVSVLRLSAGIHVTAELSRQYRVLKLLRFVLRTSEAEHVATVVDHFKGPESVARVGQFAVDWNNLADELAIQRIGIGSVNVCIPS